ncbi:MAG: hypothetical protein COB71_06365 [Thiotrichales bacterium]|nr:MAG: hypothetical protein COB71_06365 [Thiotrichales bacterium]
MLSHRKAIKDGYWFTQSCIGFLVELASGDVARAELPAKPGRTTLRIPGFRIDSAQATKESMTRMRHQIRNLKGQIR